LWEHASLKFSRFSARRKGTRVMANYLKDAPHVTPDRVVHLSSKAEDIMVIVVGGKHRHSVFLPMWTGRNTLCVIKPIDSNWSTGMMGGWCFRSWESRMED